MYKVLFDSTNTTFNKIFDNQSNFSLVEKNNIAVQSYEQTAGVGRGTKKWNSPRGNIYLTINQNKNTDEILKAELNLNEDQIKSLKDSKII